MHTQNYIDIELQSLIGVYEWERKALRPLVFDVHLTTFEPLDVSHDEMTAHLADWLKPCSYQLLEALAEHLAQRTLRRWTCRQVVISIEKPGALGDLARVGVRVVRRPLREREKLEQRVDAQLAEIDNDPKLARSFLTHPPVA